MPFSVGQPGITQPSESDPASTGMVAGVPGALLEGEEGNDKYEGLLNKRLADVDMDAGNEHGGSQDVLKEGEQPGSVDADVGGGAGSELDSSQDEGTPESSSTKKSDHKSIHSGKKRKNPTREAKTKTKRSPPLPPPRPEPRRRLKPKSLAPPIDLVERNYFEEIEFGGVSRIVDMIDLMQDVVSHSLPSNGTI